MDSTIFNCKSLIIGHRGSKGDIMENTLESLLYALRSGVDGVEFDVQWCSTGDLILFHDRTLDRLVFRDQFYFGKTKGVPVQKLQWHHFYNTELIDIMGRKYKIPKLFEVLVHPEIINSDVLIQIDIKDTKAPEPLSELLKDLIETGIYEPNRFLLSSHLLDVITYLSEFKEEMIQKDQKCVKLKIGWIVSQENLPAEGLSIFAKKHLKVLTHIVIDKDILNHALVNELKSMGLKVFVYTINGKSEYPFDDLDNIVDGIITDKPNNFK